MSEDWPFASTNDGYVVEPGLAVWDYDLKPCIVESYNHTEAGTPWFTTDNGGLFDGGRMWVYHPTTNQPARQALELANRKATCARCSTPDKPITATRTRPHERFASITLNLCDLCYLSTSTDEHLFWSETTIMTLCGVVKRGRSDKPRLYRPASPPVGTPCPDGICPSCWAAACAA